MVASSAAGRPLPRLRRLLSTAQDAALVVAASAFLVANAQPAIERHSLTTAGFAAEQVVLIGIYLTRRRPTSTSSRWTDWLAAGVASWLPLAARPLDAASGWPEVAGSILQFVGLTLTIVGFLALGRCFGIVAAHRGLQLRGPYRVVRHPIYQAEIMTSSGMLMANFTALNALVVVATIGALFVRMPAEERILQENSEYAGYRSRVRWRLLPGVY